jgi:hypothetical protein
MSLQNNNSPSFENQGDVGDRHASAADSDGHAGASGEGARLVGMTGLWIKRNQTWRSTVTTIEGQYARVELTKPSPDTGTALVSIADLRGEDGKPLASDAVLAWAATAPNRHDVARRVLFAESRDDWGPEERAYAEYFYRGHVCRVAEVAEVFPVAAPVRSPVEA